MVRYTAVVSPKEKDLLNAIRAVQYGELFGVDIPQVHTVDAMDVSAGERDLLTLIRDGIQYIDVLTVHNGQPTRIECDTICNGFRCRKKIRLPLN
jgi:hypothetical protein